MTPKKLRTACCLVCAFLCFACTSDEQAIQEQKETTLEFMMTRAGEEEAEEKINSIRMIVFDKFGKCHVNTPTPKSQTPLITFYEQVPTGLLDVYFIANEDPLWNLAAVTSPEELKGKILSFTAYPEVGDSKPIPMLGVFKNLNAVYGTTALIEGEDGKILERLYAKVTLDLYCTFANIQNTPIVLDAVRVSHMPKKSYLGGASYTDSDFFDGAKTIPSSTLHGYAPTATGFEAKGFTFYIPEHLLSARENVTYLSIFASQKDNPSVKREYTMVIGNGMEGKTVEWMKGDAPTLPELSVSRNTHYIFEGHIKGFNHELTINAKVVTWKPVEIPTQYPGYFLTVSRNDFLLSKDSEDRVYINTDHPDGWKATIESGSAAYIAFVGASSGAPGYLYFKAIDYTPEDNTPAVILITSGNLTKKITIRSFGGQGGS